MKKTDRRSTKRLKRTEPVRYNCKENDNHIIFHEEDNELWFGDCLEKEWLVYGIDDIQEALITFLKFEKSEKKD